MNTVSVRLVTIIAETILVADIKEDLQSLGASGFTMTEVKGEGSRHLHAGEIPGEKIKIECILEAKAAEKIMTHLAQKYFDHYSLIVYSQAVEVLRPEKFGKMT